MWRQSERAPTEPRPSGELDTGAMNGVRHFELYLPTGLAQSSEESAGTVRADFSTKCHEPLLGSELGTGPPVRPGQSVGQAKWCGRRKQEAGTRQALSGQLDIPCAAPNRPWPAAVQRGPA